MEPRKHESRTETQSSKGGVSFRFLDVGDIVFYRDYHGHLNHNYKWKPTKVEKISKTLAYLSNGSKAYRKPRRHRDGIGFHWGVKNGDAVYPNGN